MREASGDIFDTDCDVVCVTTNGFVDDDGECEMSHGTSLTACSLYRPTSYLLGERIQQYGNTINPLFHINEDKTVREAKGDMFAVDCDVLAITTNGFVKSNGECVMGKGCAAKAKQLYPNIAKELGSKIQLNGNVVNPLVTHYTKLVVSFPVKPASVKVTSPEDVVSHQRKNFVVGSTAPGWAAVADINIIEQSAKRLAELADRFEWETIVIPRPGCGAGELNWSDVKPVLERHLDDRFIAMTF
jgi:hypothetical protein